jgi:aminopeptidase-like protein
MRNIKRFSIASLEVTDRFLEMVGGHMHRLQVISLEYCRKITGDGVLKMVERTASLLRVDLQHTGITEKTKKAVFDELSTRSLYDVIGC